MKTQKYLIGLCIVLVFLIIFLQSSKQTVVVNAPASPPVQFSSVRKHPFDVYADPYHPPERENPYWFGKDKSYQQVGVLQGQGRAGILPLFGRPLPHSNSKWEYFTMTDGLKLPVIHNKKSCTGQPGCEEIMNPDLLDVMGLGSFKANLYDVKQPSYDPSSF